MAGALIAFEGIDQAGKLTQCRRLQERAVALGCRTALLHYPDYDTPVGQLLHRALAEGLALEPRARTMLFAANRWEQDGRVRSLLETHGLVIVDRYSASNVVYGMTQGYDPLWLRGLEHGLRPADLTLLVDISPEESVRRKKSGRDAFEQNLELLRGARSHYHDMARAENWAVVEGEADPERVAERVRQAVHARLHLRFPALQGLSRS